MRIVGVVVLSALLALSVGCTRSLDIKKNEVQRQPLALEDPRTPNIEDYTIYVITEENADMVFKRLKEEGVDPVLFGLTDRGYETKSTNDKKTVTYIIQLRRILEEYRNYYEGDK